MTPRTSYPCFRAAAMACFLTVAACHDQTGSPVEPPAIAASQNVAHGTPATVVLCHKGRQLLEVDAWARSGHEGHGDYVSRLRVDPASGHVGDGIHFARIGDAIAAARAIRVARDERHRAGCRITIDIAPGVYRGSIGGGSDPSFETLPLVIDVPDVTLHGALALVTDASGRPTGAGRGEAVTTLLPDPPLVSTSGPYSEPIFIVNGSVDGFGGDHATIEGLAFQSGHSGADFGGLGILSLRVAGLVIRGNRFEPGFLSALDLRATVGARVNGNHLSGGGGSCDICLAGPGSFRVESNRLLAGGIPGILVLPTVLLPVPPGVEQYVLPAAAEVDAALVNNEIRDHLRVPVGAGIRVGAVGVGAPDVAGRARVRARGNVLINNRFAMIVEAAFPVAGTLLKGDIELSLHHNVFAASCQNDLLVTLSRHTTGLGLAGGPYLMNSAYTLALNGNLDWANAWYSHPAGLGNTLVVDGAEVPNGTFHAYDATRTCTP